MYRFHIRHWGGGVNMAPDYASQYPASQWHIEATDNEKTQQIDSNIKASFSSTYTNMIKTWKQ